jgi:hypothetical protein
LPYPKAPIDRYVPSGYVSLGVAALLALALDMECRFHPNGPPKALADAEIIKRLEFLEQLKGVSMLIDPEYYCSLNMPLEEIRKIKSDELPNWFRLSIEKSYLRFRKALSSGQVLTAVIDRTGDPVPLTRNYWNTPDGGDVLWTDGLASFEHNGKSAIGQVAVESSSLREYITTEVELILNQQPTASDVPHTSAECKTSESTTLQNVGQGGQATFDLSQLPPYLQFMLKAAERLEITTGKHVKKDTVDEWLKENWPDDLPWSAIKMRVMGTFLRDPDAQKGGLQPMRNLRG